MIKYIISILWAFFARMKTRQQKTNRRGNQKRLCGVCESFLTGLEGNTKYAFVGCDDLGESRTELEGKLAAIGYYYDEQLNQFVAR